jgi:HAD superfamily hydrolase (TIGR01549 family)
MSNHSSTKQCVRAVFFDVGGTLETIVHDDAMRLVACEHILRILREAGAHTLPPPMELLDHVNAGLSRYFADREYTQRDLPPAKVWRDYIFAKSSSSDNQLASILSALGEEMAFVWDTEGYRREMRPEVPDVLVSLQKLGLHMGIISNTFSIHQVYHDLGRFGISHYFDPVILSTSYGHRKPAPAIFRHAAALAGVPVDACAYVGDSLLYDIAGEKKAGFGRAIWLDAPLTEASPIPPTEIKADATIHNLTNLLGLLRQWKSQNASKT